MVALTLGCSIAGRRYTGELRGKARFLFFFYFFGEDVRFFGLGREQETIRRFWSGAEAEARLAARRPGMSPSPPRPRKGAEKEKNKREGNFGAEMDGENYRIRAHQRIVPRPSDDSDYVSGLLQKGPEIKKICGVAFDSFLMEIIRAQMCQQLTGCILGALFTQKRSGCDFSWQEHANLAR